MAEKTKSKHEKTALVCKVVFIVSIAISVLSIIVTAGGAA